VILLTTDSPLEAEHVSHGKKTTVLTSPRKISRNIGILGKTDHLKMYDVSLVGGFNPFEKY